MRSTVPFCRLPSHPAALLATAASCIPMLAGAMPSALAETTDVTVTMSSPSLEMAESVSETANAGAADLPQTGAPHLAEMFAAVAVVCILLLLACLALKRLRRRKEASEHGRVSPRGR